MTKVEKFWNPHRARMMRGMYKGCTSNQHF
jgi:hypothetical protein